MRPNLNKMLTIAAFAIGFTVLAVLFKLAADSLERISDAEVMCRNNYLSVPTDMPVQSFVYPHCR